MKVSKPLKTLTALTLAAIVLASATTGCQCCTKGSATDSAKAYPLTTCLVAGDALTDKAIRYVHEGQELKFCCKDCLDEFKQDPKKHLAKLAGGQ